MTYSEVEEQEKNQRKDWSEKQIGERRKKGKKKAN